MQRVRRRKGWALTVLILVLLRPVLTLAGSDWTDKTSALRHAIKGGHPKSLVRICGAGKCSYNGSPLTRRPVRAS